MNILFFDIDITGHHSEYISHIVDYLITTKTDDNYYFIVHPSFEEKFPAIINNSLKNNSIRFIKTTSVEIEKLDAVNRIKRSKNHFKLMNYYSLKYDVEVSYLLHMNVFQIALGLYKVPYKIKGILFMQFTNMRIRSIRDYYYYLRRYFPMLLCIRNKNLDSVFLLNDRESANVLNTKFGKNNIFKYLADPIPFVESEKDFDIRAFYKIQENKKIFFHFGSLSERKGTLDILDAVYFLKDNQNNATIILAGKATDEFAEILSERITQVQNTTGIQLIWDNSFLANDRVVALFNQCDVVLIPYKNAEASSGVLGHAISSYKKVIGPSNGLIGKMIREFVLGVSIEDITPEKLANAFYSDDLINENFTYYLEYIEDHKPVNFAKTLLCS